MTAYSVALYNSIWNSKNTSLKHLFGDSYKSIPPQHIEAYLNAYASASMKGDFVLNFDNATDKQVQNWSAGRALKEKYGTDWESKLFDDFFEPLGEDKGYQAKKNPQFMVDDGELIDGLRDKCLGYLKGDDYTLVGIYEKFKDSFISGIYAIEPLILDLDGNGTKSVLSCN